MQRGIILTCLAAFCLAFLFNGAVAGSPTYIVFENFENGSLSHLSSAFNGASQQISSSVKHSGNYSEELSFTSGDGYPGAVIASNYAVSQVVGSSTYGYVQAAGTVNISLWLYSTVASPALQVQIYEYNSSSAANDHQGYCWIFTPSVSTANTWTQTNIPWTSLASSQYCTPTPPPSQTSISLSAGITRAEVLANSGSVPSSFNLYIDDIYFYNAPAPVAAPPVAVPTVHAAPVAVTAPSSANTLAVSVVLALLAVVAMMV